MLYNIAEIKNKFISIKIKIIKNKEKRKQSLKPIIFKYIIIGLNKYKIEWKEYLSDL